MVDAFTGTLSLDRSLSTVRARTAATYDAASLAFTLGPQSRAPAGAAGSATRRAQTQEVGGHAPSFANVVQSMPNNATPKDDVVKADRAKDRLPSTSLHTQSAKTEAKQQPPEALAHSSLVDA